MILRILPLVALVLGAPAIAATVSRAPFGTAADGQAVELVTLHNDHGMTVKFSTRGGAFVEIDAPDGKGAIDDVILGRPDFAAWEKAGAFNTVVGRYANRIGGGGFTLDGKAYALTGANPVTKVAMHGGPNGFASRVWRAETFQRGGDVGAVMTLVSADGENGYPGEMRVRMTYTLTQANIVRIDYDATTSKPTILNLTNHTYFALGGAKAGAVYDQDLQILATRYTPADERQVPTGEIAPVAGTPFDFRQPTRIADRIWSTHPQILIAKGIDHNFVLDAPAGTMPAPAVRLHDPASGRRLEVRTTEPGVQVYTGNNLNGAMVGAHDRTLRQGDGIAFETQHFPDSPNHANFPSTVLRPGETFRSTTEWRFSADARMPAKGRR